MRQTVLKRFQLWLRHQIGLADEDLIGKPHLPTGLLAIVQLLSSMLGIHQSEDGIEQKALGNLIVHEKRLRHRPRIGQASCLNDHAVKIQFTLALLSRQGLQSSPQIFPNGAANAPIAHLNDLLIGVRHQNVVVNVLFAKLIFNDGNLLTMCLREHSFKQRGFTRA